MGEMINISGVTLEGWDGIIDRREDFLIFLNSVNGCGAGNATFDFIPDTMYGLDVSPVCNLHDDAYTFCPPTRVAFEEANSQFYSNLKVWIVSKSNIILRYPRLVRAKTYYKAVSSFGYSAFKACKEAQGIKMEG